MTGEWVLHIDGDGFFAYCEIARFPHLRGKAVVVGEERGIACAMTYEAKALGITRGMPIFKIRDHFPEVTVLSCHFELYEFYAGALFSIVEPRVSILERYSIDECFARVVFENDGREAIETWLQKLKHDVQSALGITFSFGLARTKVLAKIASKYQKPDDCTVLWPEMETDVLCQVSIGSIWGIGRALTPRLLNNRLQTALDFRDWSEKNIIKFAAPVVYFATDNGVKDPGG